MTCFRFLLNSTALFLSVTASAQDSEHETLDKWHKAETSHRYSARYTEEHYWRLRADTLNSSPEVHKQINNAELNISTDKEQPDEQQSAETTTSSFYLKEY
jgi:negative regulator of sigma E activity